MISGDPDPTPVPSSPPGELAAVLRPREIVNAVEWMLAHDEPVAANLWAECYRIVQTAKHPRTRLMAARMFTDRFDPIPRAPAVQVETGPVTISWKSSSSTPLDPFSNGSTTRSLDTGHAPRSSSATDALENL